MKKAKKISWNSFKENDIYKTSPELHKDFKLFRKKLEDKYKNVSLDKTEKALDRISAKVKELRKKDNGDLAVYFAKEIIMKGIWKKKFLGQKHIREYREAKANYLVNEFDNELKQSAKNHRKWAKKVNNNQHYWYRLGVAEVIELLFSTKKQDK